MPEVLEVQNGAFCEFRASRMLVVKLSNCGMECLAAEANRDKTSGGTAETLCGLKVTVSGGCTRIVNGG